MVTLNDVPLLPHSSICFYVLRLDYIYHSLPPPCPNPPALQHLRHTRRTINLRPICKKKLPTVYTPTAVLPTLRESIPFHTLISMDAADFHPGGNNWGLYMLWKAKGIQYTGSRLNMRANRGLNDCRRRIPFSEGRLKILEGVLQRIRHGPLFCSFRNYQMISDIGPIFLVSEYSSTIP